MLKFKNIPDWAYDRTYMVFRRSDEDWFTLWFYDAWDDRNAANEQALEVGGETWGTDIIVKT